ncbi:hypothetical protein Tco_0556000 [Tanacetum coccineum]
MVINSPCLTDKKELAIPKQTTTGKEFSNSLMVGSLPKTIRAKNTATSKTVNSVKQIHAIVDGKAVVISKSSVRNDLLFDDEDGITCLINDEIFKNLALMGSKRVLEKPNEPLLPEGHTSRSGEGNMEHTFELTDTVLDLEKEKDAQAVEILKLKQRVKKLEKKRKSSISHPRRRIYRHVESFDDDLDEEGASKQGRTSDKTKPMFKDSDFDDLVDEGMDFVQEKYTKVVKGSGEGVSTDDTAGEGVSTADTACEGVSTADTAGEGVSTAAPRTPPTTTVFDNEDVTIAIAQTLIKMKEEKSKEKGVAIKDVEDCSRPIRSITTLQPPPTIDPKDKERDVEIALRLQAELDEELRIERERQEETSKVVIADMFDEVQARIDADYELAARMTQEEQE